MTVCGTSAWQSPEVLDGKPYGEKVLNIAVLRAFAVELSLE